MQLPTYPLTALRQRYQQTRTGCYKSMLLMIATLVVLAGCASMGAPTGRELENVQTAHKTIVLLRVEANIGHLPYEPFRADLVDDNICFGLGSFDTGGHLRRIENQRFLSPESRREGWTYMVLTPGIYYLTVQPTRGTDIFSYMGRFDAPPRWQLDIPEGARVLYAGTIRVSGLGVPLIFGGSIMREILDTSVDGTDQKSATTLSAAHFLDLGVPKVSLLQPYDGGAFHFRSPLQPTH